MKKFLLLNQDGEPICDVEYGKFAASILELGVGGNYFVVHVVTMTDGKSYSVALYRSASEAAKAVDKLNDFALHVKQERRGFEMPQAKEPVSPLEIVDLLT